MILLDFVRLASKRKKSVENYFEFQRFQARLLLKTLKKYNLSDCKKILDIGSGIGGYMYEFAKNLPGAQITVLEKNPIKFAIQKAKDLQSIRIIEGDGTTLPFKDDSFDFVMASGVIEHVNAQEKLISEMCRVCRKKGISYISFPPFYSPVGGHNLSPLHYLPGDLPMKLYSRFGKLKCESFKNYGLVKTSIRKIEMLSKKYFKILDIRPRIFNFLTPITKIPILREFFCHHVEFILQKN